MMRKSKRVRSSSLWSLILLLPVFLAVLFPALAPARAELIINEVLADPQRDWDGDGVLDYKGDEWIEVLNTGYDVEDLTQYYLRDIYGSDPHLQLEGLLRPGEVKVFYGSEAMAWQIVHGYSDYGFALNNTGETVELLRALDQEDPPSFEVVDSVTLLAHETQDDRSSGWAQEGGGWVLYDALNPYGGSLEPGPSGCQPTPGDLNFCIPLVPLERRSFGALKSLYR